MPSKIFQIDALQVRQYPTAAELAVNAAQIGQQYLQAVLAEKGQATILLATGQSQIDFLEQLIQLGGVDWSQITCFHLDEYLGIPPEHPASFRYYLRERVEKRVNPGKFYYLAGDTLEPLQECHRYSKLLQTHQPLDLCCLGLGENGHLAFNDPTVANFGDPYWVKVVKLDETNRQQQLKQGHFPKLEAVPLYALTLTIPALCTATKIICLAPELRKAAIVQRLLRGEVSVSCPASILRQQAQATLFLDQASASLL